jgi:hypothetical protein
MMVTRPLPRLDLALLLPNSPTLGQDCGPGHACLPAWPVSTISDSAFPAKWINVRKAAQISLTGA